MSRYGIVRGVALVCCLAAGAVLAESVEQMVDQGNKYWAENKPDLAEQQFKQALDADPDSLAAQKQLAALYLSQNQNQQAIDAYQTAITLQPDNPSLFLGICLAYLHEGSFSASHAMCSQALKLDPESAHAQQLKKYITAKMAAEKANLPAGHARIDAGKAEPAGDVK